jgi:hypothetical protein
MRDQGNPLMPSRTPDAVPGETPPDANAGGEAGLLPPFVRGGIGDMLLCLQSAIEARHIDVYSHFEKAPDLFTPFGVHVRRFVYCETKEAFGLAVPAGEPLRRDTYPRFPRLPAPIPRPANDVMVIGLHAEGSGFSNDILARRGRPSKNMSDRFVVRLLHGIGARYPGAHLFGFAAPNRSPDIGRLFAEHCRNPFSIVAFPNIWESLACVYHCDAVIGADSSIKSMSALLRIPTVTLVGKYRDAFRDETFIEPYVRDGIMKAIYYKAIEDVKVAEILRLLPL